MKDIRILNPKAHAYLLQKQPRSWSRAFFKTDAYCDAVENGVSESFNSVVHDARKKPIITMLEEIRLYTMERMYNNQQKGSEWPAYQPCPEIIAKLNKLKIWQR